MRDSKIGLVLVFGLVFLAVLWSAPASAATCDSCRCISSCWEECDYNGTLLTCGDVGVCKGMCFASVNPFNPTLEEIFTDPAEGRPGTLLDLTIEESMAGLCSASAV